VSKWYDIEVQSSQPYGLALSSGSVVYATGETGVRERVASVYRVRASSPRIAINKALGIWEREATHLGKRGREIESARVS